MKTKHFFFIYLFLPTILLLASCSGKSLEKNSTENNSLTTIINELFPSDKKIKITFILNPDNLDGEIALNSLLPAIELLRNNIQFRLEYAKSSSSSIIPPEIKKRCLLNLCVQQFYPQKLLPYLSCVSQLGKTFGQCSRQFHLDSKQLNSCAQGKTGEQLLIQSQNKFSVAPDSLPTIMINDNRYNDEYSPSRFINTVCALSSKNKPKICFSPPLSITAVFLTDYRCPQCKQVKEVALYLQKQIPGLKIKEIDFSTPKGKKLFNQLQIKFLPQLLFPRKIKQNKLVWNLYGESLEPKGEFFTFNKIRAFFNPNNTVSDDNSTLNPKQQSPGNNSALKTREIPNKIELFIRPRCPFGNSTLAKTKKLFKKLPGKIDFQLSFLLQTDKSGLIKSLYGGIPESRRKLCAKQLYPHNYKYMEYIWCRAQNPEDSNWKECTNDTIKADLIKKCAASELSYKLLKKNLQAGKNKGISISPSLIINNKYKYTGIKPKQLLELFCKHNQTLCKNKFTE